jgi:hypothetical protein
VFALDPATGAETVRYSFTSGSGCGTVYKLNPDAGLLYNAVAIYGTTFGGNDSGSGTVFRIQP